MLPSLNLLLAYFRKTAFPFSNIGRVQSSGGSEQQQLSVNGSFVSVWRCLLEASYSPAPGSARSPVFSLNVNIRPHLAPGESPTSKIRLHIFLSDQLYEVRAGSGDPKRSASTILFTSTRTQVQEILVSDGDRWFFVIVKTRPQRICITMHQLPCTPGSGTTVRLLSRCASSCPCQQLNTNQGWSLSLLITSSSFFFYHQISGRGCWNNDTPFS